jgi:hypothetical protein
MGKKEKIIEIAPGVINQIQKDLDYDGVHFYEIEDIPEIFINKNLINMAILDKCSCITVATSACEEDGRNYMFIAPVRVDSQDIHIVTDIDPIIMVADLTSGTPAPSGCVRFHRDFEGRTEIERIIIDPIDTPVSALRKSVKTSKKIFRYAPKRFTNAMHYMARIYRNKVY